MCVSYLIFLLHIRKYQLYAEISTFQTLPLTSLILASKDHSKADPTVKLYCSVKCRNHRWGDLDRRIETAFVHFLYDRIQAPSITSASKIKCKKHKYKPKIKDAENIVLCSTVERFVFGENESNLSVNPRQPKKSTSDCESEEYPLKDPGYDVESNSSLSDGTDRTLPALGSGVPLKSANSYEKLKVSSGNGSEHYLQEQRDKAKLGMIKAEQKEIVKRAARRGCVFGFALAANPADTLTSSNGDNIKMLAENKLKPNFDNDAIDVRRKCEAVSNGRVVEPSFAKGNWGIRWREDGS